MDRITVFVVALSLVIIISLGLLARDLILSSPTPPTGPPVITTLAEIAEGKFPSAVDKAGDGGAFVEVRNVTVLKVLSEESDGDWHVYIKDGTFPRFISEIIPRDQATLGRPPRGLPLVVRGITYCDPDHATEAWHGGTCWEIHPLTSWAAQ